MPIQDDGRKPMMKTGKRIVDSVALAQGGGKHADYKVARGVAAGKLAGGKK